MNWRRPSTTADGNSTPRFRVVHPFHPLSGREYELVEPVVDFLEAALAEDGSLNSTRLARLLQDRLGLQAHPRSVERALARRRKKGPRPPA